jgi:phage tail-like protein
MASNVYAVCFYFELLFKGEKIAFQEVSGLTEELNVEEIVCGGENRFKYKLPTVVSNQNLVLKRALIPANSGLVTWCKNSIGGGLANRSRQMILPSTYWAQIKWYL